MGRFYSIPGTTVHNSTEGARPSVDPSTHPQFREFYDAKRRRGDNANAQVGLPKGTPITLDGQPGIVEGEETTSGGDIVTVVRGEKSTTRRVRWGQDKQGQLTVAESKRSFE